MPRLPRPTGAEIVRFLETQGFRIVRIRGSYHVLEKGMLRTTVPVHSKQILRIGTLRGILRDVDMAPAVFTGLWRG